MEQSKDLNQVDIPFAKRNYLNNYNSLLKKKLLLEEGIANKFHPFYKKILNEIKKLNFSKIIKIESSFGRFLDPVADKILVVSIIFILISNGIIKGIFVYPALIIVIREILVSGLRDFFAHSTETLLVTNLSKWKTLIQMCSLGFLMVSNDFETSYILFIGYFGLTVASIMTIHTGYIYFK